MRKMVYPCIPQFCYIKVGYKGVYITKTCFPDVHPINSYGYKVLNNWRTSISGLQGELLNHNDTEAFISLYKYMHM